MRGDDLISKLDHELNREGGADLQALKDLMRTFGKREVRKAYVECKWWKVFDATGDTDK
jgi:hypothetical protein